RWSLDQAAFTALPLLPLGAQTGVMRDVPARSLGFGYTRLVTTAIVNEARFAYNHVGLAQDATQPLEDLIPGALAPTTKSGTPTINVNGYAGVGARPANFDNVPVTKDSFVYNFSDNLSIVSGKHTTKIGFDFQEIYAPTFATLDGRGSFGFTGVFTQNPQRRPGSGSSIADLLLGVPNTITVGTPSDAHERTRNYYFYVQHDWIVTSRLTLNMGLRYEITSPFWDDNGRLANLVVDAGTPLYGQYVIAGDPRVPRSLQTTDYNNFAPRFGFAWKGPKATVVRGGFGLFYAQDEGFGVSQRPTNNAPFVGFGGYAVVSDQLNISSTIPFSQPLPARPAAPDPKAYKFDPKATVQIRSWPLRYTIPYVEQWNLSVQKELARNFVWEIGYVGNHGVKLYGAYEGTTLRRRRELPRRLHLRPRARHADHHRHLRRLHEFERQQRGGQRAQPPPQLRPVGLPHEAAFRAQRGVGTALRQGQEGPHPGIRRRHRRRMGADRHHHPLQRHPLHPGPQFRQRQHRQRQLA
ncbi:MAG: TonB-dependent receptor, partial [Acidobacteria bacterium]|nr:TonB-dependent receptor [Acidobacteriota bacterium]